MTDPCCDWDHDGDGNCPRHPHRGGGIIGYTHPPNACMAAGVASFIEGPKGTPCSMCGSTGIEPVHSIRMRYESAPTVAPTEAS